MRGSVAAIVAATTILALLPPFALAQPVEVLTRPITDPGDASRACPAACGRAGLPWTGEWRPINEGGVCACAPGAPPRPPWFGPGPRAVGPGGSCSAPANHQCVGCSISCLEGQQASCQEGSRGIFTGDNDTLCSRPSRCECH